MEITCRCNTRAAGCLVVFGSITRDTNRTQQNSVCIADQHTACSIHYFQAKSINIVHCLHVQLKIGCLLIDMNIRYGKAEFIGRDALRRIHDIGNFRRLVGIEIEGEAIQPNESFWTVTERGKKVGHVSRACWSPRLEKNIGFANLPHNLTETGTQINVDCPDGDRPAVVVQAPWFPAEKVLPTLEEIRAA